MAKITALSGSLREKSLNAALLRAAADLAPDGLIVEIGTIRGVPLYNGDIDTAEGQPDAVGRLKDQLAGSDGLLLVTPEYNHSIPGVFKNAIDWLSRPPKDIGRLFKDKPVGLIGATPGRNGTVFAQTAWLPVFRALGLRPFFGGSLYVSRAYSVFDDDLKLVDDTVRELLTVYMADFARFVG